MVLSHQLLEHLSLVSRPPTVAKFLLVILFQMRLEQLLQVALSFMMEKETLLSSTIRTFGMT